MSPTANRKKIDSFLFAFNYMQRPWTPTELMVAAAAPAQQASIAQQAAAPSDALTGATAKQAPVDTTTIRAAEQTRLSTVSQEA